MLLTTLWPMTSAHAQDGLGLPIDYQMPEPLQNWSDEMYPDSPPYGWSGSPPETMNPIWEPSTSGRPWPSHMDGILHVVEPEQAMMTVEQLQELAGENIALTIISASLLIGGMFYLAGSIVKNMTLDIIMRAQVPGEGFSLAVAKYLHATDPGAFEKAEKEAFLKQHDARDRARVVSDVADVLRTIKLTEFLAKAEDKITNTYFKASLKTLSLIETGLTLTELTKSGVFTSEQKVLIKPVLALLIESLQKVAAERREAAYQSISETLPLVRKSKMGELEAADALEEFVAELKTSHTRL